MINNRAINNNDNDEDDIKINYDSIFTDRTN